MKTVTAGCLNVDFGFICPVCEADVDVQAYWRPDNTFIDEQWYNTCEHLQRNTLNIKWVDGYPDATVDFDEEK